MEDNVRFMIIGSSPFMYTTIRIRRIYIFVNAGALYNKI